MPLAELAIEDKTVPSAVTGLPHPPQRPHCAGPALNLPGWNKKIRGTLGSGCPVWHPSGGEGRSRAQSWGWTCTGSRARGAALSQTSSLESYENHTLLGIRTNFFLVSWQGQIGLKKTNKCSVKSGNFRAENIFISLRKNSATY